MFSALRIGLLAAILAMPALSAFAVLVRNDLSDYSQDFDHLNNSFEATANTWVDDQASESTTGSPGWLWQTGATPLVYDAGNPSNPGPYSLGTADSVPPDRAMGAFNDASVAGIAWGVVFQNSTGQTISQVGVTYTGEQWRRASTSADQLSFSWQISANNISDLQPTSGGAPGSWTPVAALDFLAPLAPGSPPFFRTAAPSDTLTETISLNLPDGFFLALRWHDGDVAGDDAGLGIDDLTVSFHAASVPEPSAFLFGALVCGVAAGPWAVGRRR